MVGKFVRRPTRAILFTILRCGETAQALNHRLYADSPPGSRQHENLQIVITTHIAISIRIVAQIEFNLDTVDLELVTDPSDVQELRGMLERHLEYTGSPRARDILADWESSLPAFVKVFPMEYRRALGQMSKEDEATEREEIADG